MTRFIALFLFGITICYSQAPAIDWQKTIGGSNQDLASIIRKTTDDGYIIGGRSVSPISGDKTQNLIGGYDYWIVKTDISGNILWEKTIGGTGFDEITDLVQTNDGGYLLAGDSFSNISGDKTENSRGYNDFWIVKLNSNGVIEWQKTIGGAQYEILTEAQQTSDGGYILGGYSNSDISGEKTENCRGNFDYWIVKLNASGTIEWQKTLGGSEHDWLNSVKQTSDGHYILAGKSFSGISGDRTISNSPPDSWILKLDATGNIIWQKSHDLDETSTIIETSDGNYLVAGSRFGIYAPRTNSLSNQFYSTIFKINTDGILIWDHSIQPDGGDCTATDVVEGNDGYYYSTNSQNSSYNTCITKINFSGHMVWNKNFLATGEDYTYSIATTSDNSVVCAISTASDIFGDKTDNSKGLNDYWIVKFNPSALGTIETENLNFVLYPNPVNDSFYIQANSVVNDCDFSFYNTLGQKIMSFQKTITTTTPIDFPFPKGIYFLKITNPITNQTQTIKINKS